MANAQRIASSNGSARRAIFEVEPRTLEDLRALPAERLAELYAAGRTPQLGVLAGPTRGALLAVPAIAGLPVVGGLVHRVVRAVAALPWAPWKGKTFAAPQAPHETTGRNRIFGFEAFPFDAHIERSALDHVETLVLRYDRSENPRMLRMVVDELREVARGLWLGPAYVRGANGPLVVLWWAVVKE